MNRFGTIFILVMGLAAFNSHALEARPSLYDKIPERNLFQLHAPTVRTIDLPPKPPLRKATLTGITTILGRRLAFITIEATKSQPAESVTLAEGQALNGIDVKGIDEKAAVVKILNDGELQILTFEAAKSSGLPPNENPKASAPVALPVQAGVEATMTPEEQAALIELQRIKFKQEGNPTYLILPPTEVSSGDESNSRE
jgi:hypothetical protein